MPQPASDNAAWVTIETPLSADALATLCADIEHLYRINPYFEFRSWRALARDTWHVTYEQAEREAGRSLHAWGVALNEYFKRHAPWRWYMRHVWTLMKPSARRITYIILLITLAELALFALAMAVWWAEHRA